MFYPCEHWFLLALLEFWHRHISYKLLTFKLWLCLFDDMKACHPVAAITIVYILFNMLSVLLFVFLCILWQMEICYFVCDSTHPLFPQSLPPPLTHHPSSLSLCLFLSVCVSESLFLVCVCVCFYFILYNYFDLSPPPPNLISETCSDSDFFAWKQNKQ